MTDPNGIRAASASADAEPAVKPGGASPEPRRARREWVGWKMLRLSAYAFVVTTAAGLFAARAAYSDVKDSALGIGRELGRLGDLGAGRVVRINGQRIHVGSTTEDMPFEQVLDAFEAHCEAHSAARLREFAALSAEEKTKIAARAGSTTGVLRRQSAFDGAVACLVTEDEEGTSVPGLAARLGAFAETGDLGRLGGLRYVYARRTKNGRTHLVTAWTDGELRLFDLYPKEGDAPGADMRDVPRPDGAARLLTADIEGMPYGVRIYDAPGAAEDVLAMYERELPARGWELSAISPDAPLSRTFTKDGVDLLVTVAREGDRTFVTLAEMRGR